MTTTELVRRLPRSCGSLACEREPRWALEHVIVPGFGRSPLVSGHWTIDQNTLESVVLLTFETRAAAEAITKNMVGNAEHQRASGLEPVGVRILEIAASPTAGVE